MVTKVCPCGVTFEAKSSNAKWHSPGCAQRAYRARGTTADLESPSTQNGSSATQNVSPRQRRTPVAVAGAAVLRRTRAELRELRKLDTLEGAQALLLATRIAEPGESGASVARLVGELTRLMGELRAATPGADPVESARGAGLSVVRGGVA